MDNNIQSCCGAAKRSAITKKNMKDNNQSITAKETSSNENMVLIQGGKFLMGTNDPIQNRGDFEGPVREVAVDSFYIDKYSVTNEQFSQFIDETGYVTDAEKYGWSFVFYQFVSKELEKNISQVVQQTPWWYVVEGAYWKHPEGPDSSIDQRLDHPAVHISWNDAQAYCKWAGKRLPTEKEWEYAARGDLIQQTYPWGNELLPDGKHQCNIWQGKFPQVNTKDDGFFGTAPVHTYEANGYGLYQMIGNVWEWCSHPFYQDTHLMNPEYKEFMVMKGGSYLCHESYCNRYRVAARTGNTMDSSTGNLGFRCVKDL